MRAFHNDLQIQQKYYKKKLGLPKWLTRLEDTLFDGMSQQKSKSFPLEFLNAINLGGDLEQIKKPFIIYILEQALTNFNNEQFPNITNAINRVINLHNTIFEPAPAAEETRWLAWYPAWLRPKRPVMSPTEAAAWLDAWITAKILTESTANAATWSVLESGSTGAESPIWLAAQAGAEAAMWAAMWARTDCAIGWSTQAAAWPGEAAIYDKFADKLIELIKGCK